MLREDEHRTVKVCHLLYDHNKRTKVHEFENENEASIFFFTNIYQLDRVHISPSRNANDLLDRNLSSKIHLEDG